MLENVSEAYDAEVSTRIQALTTLLEPMMIVIMGGVVGHRVRDPAAHSATQRILRLTPEPSMESA